MSSSNNGVGGGGIVDALAVLALMALTGLLIWGSSYWSTDGRADRTIPLPTSPLSMGSNTLGSPDADMALLVFSDFECPFCGRFARDVFPAIAAKYVVPGQLRVGFRHLPLDTIHRFAQPAAEAAECAADQKKFWPMHDALFSNQVRLSDETIRGHASAIGLIMADFDSCVMKRAVAARIEKDTTDAKALGVAATPMFLVGTLEADGSISVKRAAVGALTLDELADLLDGL